MRFFLILFFICSQFASAEDIKSQVQEFIRKLDGDFKERSEASKQLHKLPVEFYPYLRDYLKKENASVEIKLRLSPEKMYPLRAKWLQQKRMDWYKDNLIEAYKKHGHKNRKWDNDVFKGFKLILLELENKVEIGNNSKSIRRNFGNAVRKGCKDPLVLYFHARGSKRNLSSDNLKQVKGMHFKAQAALIDSEYHDYFKFRACRLAATYSYLQVRKYNENFREKTKEEIEQARAYLKTSIKFLENSLKDEELPFPELYINTKQFIDVFSKVGATRREGFEMIEPLIITAYGQKSMQHLAIKGWLAVQMAPTHEINPQVRDAIGLLTSAWELDPAQIEISKRLLDLAYRLKNEEQFNKWYKNLTLAEPDSNYAFNTRVKYIKNYKTKDAFWDWAEEIASDGSKMSAKLSSIFFEIVIEEDLYRKKCFLLREAIYQHPRAVKILHKAFNNYLHKNPHDHEMLIDYAYLCCSLGLWKKAHELFSKVGNKKIEKQYLSALELKEYKEEASLYASGKIEPQPPYLNRDERRLNAYAKRKKSGAYDFAEFFSKINGVNNENEKLVNALKAESDYWYKNPANLRDTLNTQCLPHEVYAEYIKNGLQDPLVKFLWSVRKDHFDMADKSETFIAAQSLIESEYPNSIKLTAILKAAYYLHKQKNVSEKEKAVAKTLNDKIPELIDESIIDLEMFDKYFWGYRKIKLFKLEDVKPIIDRYSKLGKKYEALVVEGLSLNCQAYVEYEKNRKKFSNFLKYERACKIAMKKAWRIKPEEPLAAFMVFYSTRPQHDDYEIQARRAMYTNIDSDKAQRHHLYGWGHPSGRTLRWSKQEPDINRCSLLHHTVAEYKVRKYKDEKLRLDFWSDAKNAFEAYLEKFPGDTEVRSKYALFAIKCKKNNIAKEQLKILGPYADLVVFGGSSKLEDYKKSLQN